MGNLLHIENGPLFGPAMNRAYALESKNAINPRVLIDEPCLEHYLKVETFEPMKSLISSDEEFSYLSLATAFRHTINDGTEALAGEKVLARHRQSLAGTSDRLLKIRAAQSDEKIQSKYTWLLQELEKTASEIRAS